VTEPGTLDLADAEFVVVGAGLLGLSTAWHLANRGREVAVLEKEHVGHACSGSKGLCRIFRLGYDDPRYVEMAKLALPLWREWESEAASGLLTTTGQLTFGPDLASLSGALSEAGAPYEIWPADEAARRFPEVAAPGPAVFEPRSGVIHAERCLDMLRRRVSACLHEGVEVTGLVDGGRHIRIVTTGGNIRAGVVVCCAGSQTTTLLATAGIGLALAASLEQVAYFAPRYPYWPSLPVVVERGHPMLYGLPTPDGQLVKIGQHQSAPLLAEEAANLDPDPEDDAPLAAAVTRLLPAFDPRPVRSERCFYDNSPDEDFVIDRVGRVVVGAGTSGHGFKFGPVLGELLADLAEGRSPRAPID
jgi:sarcosine oxidase